MKKLLTLAALLGTAAMSFGQGYVNFQNLSTSRVSTNGTLQAAAPVGTWYYALLVAPSTQGTISSDYAGWTFAAIGTNTSSAGRLLGNNADGGLAVQIAGFAATATADFAVVGWSSNIGTDWNAYRAWWNNGSHDTGASAGTGGWSGTSVVAQDIALAPSGGPYNSMFGPASAGAIPGMNLAFTAAVPEPSTMALAGLGAAALVIFRRRKV
jgi:hypothetical protein